MPIVRRGADLDLAELGGLICEQLFTAAAGERLVLFTRIDGTWHRFYVRDGELHWREGQGPDTEDDMDGEDSYVDLGVALNAHGAAFRQVCMHNGRLEVSFSNGARFAVVDKQGADGPQLVEQTRGQLR